MSDYQFFLGNGKILHKIRHHEEDIHDITWAPPGKGGEARLFCDDGDDAPEKDDDEGDDGRALFAASGRDRQGRYSAVS